MGIHPGIYAPMYKPKEVKQNYLLKRKKKDKNSYTNNRQAARGKGDPQGFS